MSAKTKTIKTQSSYIRKAMPYRAWLLVLLLCFIPLKEVTLSIFPSFFSWQKSIFEQLINFPLCIPNFIGYQGVLHVTEIALLLTGLYLTLKKTGYVKNLTKQPTLFLVLFAAVAILSIALSPCKLFFFPYFTVISLLALTVAFDQISTHFNAYKTFALFVVATLIILGTFEAGVCILQFLYQKSVGLRVFGEQKLYVDKDFAIATFPINQALRSFLALFSPVLETRMAVLRSYGTMNHPNIIAGFLLLTSITTLNAYITNALKGKRPALIASFFLQVLGLLFTFSRGGLIGFIVATIALLFLTINRSSFSIKQLFMQHKKVVFSFSLALIAMNIALVPFYKARAGLVHQTAFTKEVDSYRLLFIKQAWLATANKPLLGNGYGCFTFFPAPYLAHVKNTPATAMYPDFSVTRDRPHNVFLMISGETGLIGLLLFLTFFSTIFYHSWKVRKFLNDAGFVSALLGFMFISMIDIYPLSDFEGKMCFFVCAALSWGAVLKAKKCMASEQSA
ncbi:hypothetical protein COB21_03205 [Candidatus Aerophobetes bacterium]|uniref:O-antigen ligase-related domain-containing protein n=1 Tax=Aerophobetes bacterium TaxID=2030807 RepID=A0A2A4X5Q8_UNCAE|nr:MAG: hypothetical protein COB21_03205 [Candidatus Aerophobetes bacterium]